MSHMGDLLARLAFTVSRAAMLGRVPTQVEGVHTWVLVLVVVVRGALIKSSALIRGTLLAPLMIGGCVCVHTLPVF